MINNKVARDLFRPPTRLYSLDWQPPPPFPPFSRYIICEGTVEYTGCSSTEQRGFKARAWPSLPSCPEYLREDAGEYVLHCDGILKGLLTILKNKFKASIIFL